MKVLVTGSAVFIGNNIVIHLKGQGYEAIAFDNLERVKEFALEKIALHKVP
ncbi:MAG: NAD-dependent epimerase/dehydratase family protein [Candidatus Bathyarchaeia archaeon]